MAQHSADK